MLDIKYIRENKELVIANSKNRLATVDIERLLSVDEARRALQVQIQELRTRRNQASKSKPSAEEISQMKAVGDTIAKLETEEIELSNVFTQLLLDVPNLTHPEVRVSENDADNPVMESVGKIPTFKFEVKDHVELAEELNLIDFERGTKIAGSKFYFLKNELVLLSRALVDYALAVAMKHGFKPMLTPDLAKTSLIEGMGYNPRGESSQIYTIKDASLSLIGTSEITLGGYHSDETIDLSTGPLKYLGLSNCFRTEAGSYSKFSKGLFRVHQFEKLEMFIFSRPEEAERLHSEMLKVEKEIFKGLGIPFRVIDHCTADLGAPSYRTYDLEAWLPGKPNQEGNRGDWAEITSTSNCTDYQSRSLNIKFADADGQKKLVYTLNGTAVAVSRALIAIIENYQTKDGSITVPKVLRKYLPFKKIGA